MFDTPVKCSRPVKTFDGEGPTETISPTAGVIWADPLTQDNKPTLRIHMDEDVRVGDLIEVPYDLFAKEVR